MFIIEKLRFSTPQWKWYANSVYLLLGTVNKMDVELFRFGSNYKVTLAGVRMNDTIQNIYLHRIPRLHL